MVKHIPNILTTCRFVFIPFIFGAIVNKNFIAAFIFLTISGITDVLDGFIARKFNCITKFGKLIDPLADKMTQIATLIALSYINIIPYWILIIVFIKETVMVAGASFLYGMLLTVVFYIEIGSSLVINYFDFKYHVDIYIYYIALILTIFALVMYFREFYKKGYVNKEELKTADREIITK